VSREAPPLRTSRYQNRSGILASGLVPVRITLGHPRWKLGYELGATVRELAPDRAMMGLGEEAFREAYTAKLERLGHERIAAILSAVSAQHGGRGLVLLCYEDLTKPGESCHRRLFAEVWERWTGEEVPELAIGTSVDDNQTVSKGDSTWQQRLF
jgi:hypothetical protein